MRLTGDMITGYARRIYGFAMEKLRDPDRAGDLSQEIILELLRAAARGCEAENPDGYVYTVCRHVFARNMRYKYRHGETLSEEGMSLIPSEENIAQTVEEKQIADRLKREVSRLSGTHRLVTVMFYFDNIPGEEIARRLGIPHSTVRYYLGESRRKLKEGIDMNENLSCDIVKICAGHDGNAMDMKMHGLDGNPLVGNIAAACREKPLTVEEISRATGVGAVYLEYYLDDLVYMDYMKKVGSRYVTNFWLRTPENGVRAANYAYVNAAAPAEEALKALQERMKDIISIGFTGSGSDRDFLCWIFYGDLIRTLINSAYAYPLDKGRKYHEMPNPLRADGSAHWVWAAIVGDVKRKVPTAEGFGEYAATNLSCNGVKTRSAEDKIFSLQFDYGTGWRKFNGEELSALGRIRELILSGDTPSDHDKFLIAGMAREGYVTVTDGDIRFNIPYMTGEEYKKYRDIIDEIGDSLGRDFLLSYVKGMGDITEPDIPGHLDEEMRFYYKYSNVRLWDFFHIVKYKGLLSLPEDIKTSGFCTLVYEK